MVVHAERRTSADVTAAVVLAAVMVETSDDAIIPVSAGYGVTGWGPTAERLFGVPRPARGRLGDNLIDQLFSLMSGPPGSGPSWRGPCPASASSISRARSSGATGYPFRCGCRSAPWPTPTGEPWGVVAIARDVTEQHLAQASLAEVEGRLQDAEALSHVGSWLWDLRTGSVQWSAEFHRIHGWIPSSSTGLWQVTSTPSTLTTAWRCTCSWSNRRPPAAPSNPNTGSSGAMEPSAS